MKYKLFLFVTLHGIFISELHGQQQSFTVAQAVSGGVVAPSQDPRYYPFRAFHNYAQQILNNYEHFFLRCSQWKTVCDTLRLYPAFINRTFGERKNTTLMWAINEECSIKFFEQILSIPGIDVNMQNTEGETALTLAVADLRYGKGNPGVHEKISYLLACNAHIAVRAREEATVLHRAVVAKLLPDVSDEKRFELFETAKKIITHLVVVGADIDAQNSLGCTPVMVAAYRNDPFMVEFLLTQGADPDIVIQTGIYANCYLDDFAVGKPDVVRVIENWRSQNANGAS